MSSWFFLSEWFEDVPTYVVLFRRMLINIVVAIVIVCLFLTLGVPDLYGELILLGMLVVNGVLMHSWRWQRSKR